MSWVSCLLLLPVRLVLPLVPHQVPRQVLDRVPGSLPRQTGQALQQDVQSVRRVEPGDLQQYGDDCLVEVLSGGKVGQILFEFLGSGVLQSLLDLGRARHLVGPLDGLLPLAV